MSAMVARRIVESFHGTPVPLTRREILSPREAEALNLKARGKRVKEVAAELGVSLTTVQTHRCRICEKLQVNSQAEAVAKFLR